MPKLTKTHRWPPELYARAADLARRTGRPVQHVLDDAVAIGLEQIEEEIDARMRAMSPAEAWEGFVGSQTPQEFWELSHEQGAATYAEAAQKYARDLPRLFRDWTDREAAGDYPDLDRLADLLARYLQDNLG